MEAAIVALPLSYAPWWAGRQEANLRPFTVQVNGSTLLPSGHAQTLSLATDGTLQHTAPACQGPRWTDTYPPLDLSRYRWRRCPYLSSLDSFHTGDGPPRGAPSLSCAIVWI